MGAALGEALGMILRAAWEQQKNVKPNDQGSMGSTTSMAGIVADSHGIRTLWQVLGQTIYKLPPFENINVPQVSHVSVIDR